MRSAIIESMNGCKIPECDGTHLAKGYCGKHYQRLNSKTGRAKPYWTSAHRVMATGWTVTESGCWEWRGARDVHGYGVFRSQGKTARAHRVSYEMAVGPIPEGMGILHLCDNPPCINPAHLEPGDQATNMAQARERRRVRQGEGSHLAKLTWEKVREIRRLSGERTLTSLAEEFGVSTANVSLIVKNKTWVNDPGE